MSVAQLKLHVWKWARPLFYSEEVSKNELENEFLSVSNQFYELKIFYKITN